MTKTDHTTAKSAKTANAANSDEKPAKWLYRGRIDPEYAHGQQDFFTLWFETRTLLLKEFEDEIIDDGEIMAIQCKLEGSPDETAIEYSMDAPNPKHPELAKKTSIRCHRKRAQQDDIIGFWRNRRVEILDDLVNTLELGGDIGLVSFVFTNKGNGYTGAIFSRSVVIPNTTE